MSAIDKEIEARSAKTDIVELQQPAVAALRHCFDGLANARLIDVRFTDAKSETVIAAVVRGTQAPSAAEVAAAQRYLPRPLTARNWRCGCDLWRR